MLLTDLVAPNAIIPALKVNGKKQILQELAAKAAELCGQGERGAQQHDSQIGVEPDGLACRPHRSEHTRAK